MTCGSVPPAGFYASDRLFQHPHLNRFWNMSIHTGCQRMLNILRECIGGHCNNRNLLCQLRRAPTYCHSLSIRGKVNPYGTLYKTVSDSIRVILNTPSVKLWKLADCLLQLIIGECLDITIGICYMTTMLRTFDHGKQYSSQADIRNPLCYLLITE